MALKTRWARFRRPWPWNSRLGDARTAMLQLLGFASWIPLMIWFNLHVAELTLIDGPSMHPLLNSDWGTTLRRDLVLNCKWNPLNGLKRGMVVTLRSPYDPESVLVKRVVALPGDVVQTKPPYQFPLQRVPQGHVWVEGDGPPGTSRDSNTFGPVSMRLLTGRIQYANRHRMPFLAVSGGHGWLSTLNRLQAGIQINMRKMNHTWLSPDGKTANVSGGTLQREITAAMFAQGKRAVTGICPGVSVIGPLLGGGHSLLQAQHGFAADNLVSARVVLADGSVVTASARENADLFWGIRGAGHNFGIVTSFDVKAYDARGLWTVTRLIFGHEKLEKIVEMWNELEDGYEDRGLLSLWGEMRRDDEVDRHHLVILLRITSEGNTPIMAKFREAFRRLEPTKDSTVENLTWEQVQLSGAEAKSSDTSQNMMGFPSSLNRWDAAAMRTSLDLLSELLVDDTFSSSRILLQSYGNKAVRDVPDSANAVAPEERRYGLLLAASLTWRGDDRTKLAKARDFGNRIQNATRTGDVPHHSYLNYAQGHESLEEVYGRDEARISKLRELKRRYDPLNRFGFYMPL
ncbi:hypothetical protein CP533_2144 [Ophiocordyceps camponoti-saundersi (nom. inval.)]|nr:hypothetical protein CP533_2144 [Ophiocordyceps camponoti-saundersi (nom. inval.)]